MLREPSLNRLFSFVTEWGIPQIMRETNRPEDSRNVPFWYYFAGE
jgi:hypothetical protein